MEENIKENILADYITEEIFEKTWDYPTENETRSLRVYSL